MWLNSFRKRRSVETDYLSGIKERFYHALAVQHYLAGDASGFDSALRNIGAAVADFPDMGFIDQALLANIRFNSGAFAEASKLYDAAIAKATGLRRELEESDIQPGNRARLAHYAQILAILFNNLAMTRAEEGDLVSAELALHEALRHLPDWSYLYESLAAIAIKKRDFKAAEQAYKHAFQSDSEKSAARRLQGNLGHLRRAEYEASKNEDDLAKAEEALRQAIVSFTEGDEPAWGGRCHFDLGKLLESQERLSKAREHYEAGVVAYTRVSEQSIETREEKLDYYDSASYLKERAGELFLRMNSPSQALETFEQARSLAEKIVDGPSRDRELARLCVRCGLLRAIAAEQYRAVEDIVKGAALAESLAEPNLYISSIEDFAPFFASDDHRRTARNLLEQVIARTGDPTTKKRLRQGLLAIYGMSGAELSADASADQAPIGMRLPPIVHPIWLELDSRFIPKGQDATVVQLSESLQARIESTFGLRLPVARTRVFESDAEGYLTYVLIINGIAPVIHRIPPDKRLFVGEASALRARGINGEDALVPFGQENTHWIERSDWNKAGELSLWDILEYPIRHLEALLTSRLDLFLGIEETAEMLNAQNDEQNARILASDELLSHFTLALKALLSEKTPIMEFNLISAEFLRLKEQGNSLTQIVESVRRLPQLKPALWGNDRRFSLCPLTEMFERELALRLRTEDGLERLEMEPEFHEKAFETIRRGLEEPLGKAVLVRRSNLRPFVRKLIAGEFPDTPVLSLDQLTPGVALNVLTPIGVIP